MTQDGRTLYVGVDESNPKCNGESRGGNNSKAYHVATFSQERLDVRRSEIRLLKRSKGLDKFIEENLHFMDYSFIELDETQHSLMPEETGEGLILSSLVSGRNFQMYEKIVFYIDGRVPRQKKRISMELAGLFNQIPAERIEIRQGKEFDRIIPLVNFSDNIARYLFRNFPDKIPEELRVRERQKFLSWHLTI